MKTVSDLIAELSTYPPEMRVVLNGYEYGYCDISDQSIKQIEIDLNVNDVGFAGEHDDGAQEKVVLISRSQF